MCLPVFLLFYLFSSHFSPCLVFFPSRFFFVLSLSLQMHRSCLKKFLCVYDPHRVLFSSQITLPISLLMVEDMATTAGNNTELMRVSLSFTLHLRLPFVLCFLSLFPLLLLTPFFLGSELHQRPLQLVQNVSFRSMVLSSSHSSSSNTYPSSSLLMWQL